MCGICGLVVETTAESRGQRVELMVESLRSRGPNDQGVWNSDSAPLSLGHSRLSILDLTSAGKQPMQSSNGRFVIVFNGEIYNYQEIKSELTNVNFKSSSDTEVLLEAISLWGIEKTLLRLNGMFAFAVYDRLDRKLTLCRDRLGIKPLYFGWVDNEFFFASELKAMHGAGLKPQINREAVADFIRWSYVPAPRTIAKDVFKMLPGTYIELEVLDLVSKGPTQPKFNFYWQLSSFVGADPTLDEVNYLDQIHESVVGAVKRRLVSDVPLGAFLSGGIDSSTIVACMQSASGSPVQTFTIGFESREYDESPHAKRVAEYLGLDHHELLVTPTEAQAIIPSLADVYDEPFADSSQIPTVLVSKLAAQSVRVALSGDGGDEVFCGYNRYVWGSSLWRSIEHTPQDVRRGLRSVLNRVPPRFWNYFFNIAKPVMPKSLNFKLPAEKLSKFFSVMDAATFKDLYQKLLTHCENPRDVVKGLSQDYEDMPWWDLKLQLSDTKLWMMYMDSVSYLPGDLLTKVDRASMAHSLEVRVPFLDHTLVELLWATPAHIRNRKQGGMGKVILREILAKYLPTELFERPKMGFSVPIGEWLRGPLQDWADQLMGQRRLESQGLLSPMDIRKKWSEHLSLQANWQYYLWNILMLQSWIDKEFVDV